MIYSLKVVVFFCLDKKKKHTRIKDSVQNNRGDFSFTVSNLETIGFTASEKMSIEKIDRQTTDGQRMPTYTISSPMSLRLR